SMLMGGPRPAQTTNAHRRRSLGKASPVDSWATPSVAARAYAVSGGGCPQLHRRISSSRTTRYLSATYGGDDADQRTVPIPFVASRRPEMLGQQDDRIPLALVGAERARRHHPTALEAQ